MWWLATFPGLAIFITTLAINMAGDGLRDFFDPHRKN
jgi:ABC-type dipeptide/oligopeptide/nickel transport system permease subunit